MTGEVDTLRDRAREWLRADPDPETRAELEALLSADDRTGLADRFAGALTFGTAGLRGVMGAGPNRMNRVVVRRATAGLMAYLPRGARVVIGHDSRRNSATFARDVAAVVAGAGGRALALPCNAPTPLVAFAVRHLAADAGVACTASHNPPEDNGYKVYLADGAQVVPPVDAEIADAIARTTAVPWSDDGEHIVQLGRDVEDEYVDHVAALAGANDARRHVSVVYSALHGVGAKLTQAVFDRAGFSPLHLVAEQCTPDGAFPTVAVPNPELADATRLATEALARTGADVALVHDPDADRLAVVLPDAGGARRLSGNEIGLLLADHLLRRGAGADRLVVDTVVSSSALAAVAADHGVHHERTLTGFKWIVRPAIERPDLRFVFGYEEALGFSVDHYVRDKDAISASVVFADLVASLKVEQRTVLDRLAELAERYGLFATETWTLPVERGVAVTDRLRDQLPDTIGGLHVVSVVDYARGEVLPPADLVEIRLEDGVRVCVRPSGTEAKLKVYAEVVLPVGDDGSYAQAVEQAASRLDALRAAVLPLVGASAG